LQSWNVDSSFNLSSDKQSFLYFSPHIVQ